MALIQFRVFSFRHVPNRLIWFENCLVAVTGFSLGVYPEVSVALASICGVLGAWRFVKKWYSVGNLLIIAFALLRFLYFVSSQRLNLFNMIEILIILVLPRAAWILTSKHRMIFGYATIFGLLITVGFAFSQAWNPNLDTWRINKARINEEITGKLHKFSANHMINAWIMQSLGVQGPGKVEYLLNVRTQRPTQVTLMLIHEYDVQKRETSVCKTTRNWSKCKIQSVLPSTGQLSVVISLTKGWKKGDLDIELNSPKFETEHSVFLLDRLRFMPRQMGFSFNENAFGAWLVVAFLLALCTLESTKVTLLMTIPIFFGVYLSGSRGAMFAAAISLFAFVLLQSRWSKLVILVLLACSLFVVATQINANRAAPSGTASISPGFRAFRLNGFDDALSRVEIWRDSLARSISVPVFGFDPRHTEQIQNARDPETVLPAHAHNLWLEMMAEGGLLQLSLLAGLMAFVVFRLVQSHNLIWLTPLIGILLINISDFIFYYAPIRVCFGLLLGLEVVKRPSPA
jgi:O-Antigen ligase